MLCPGRFILVESVFQEMFLNCPAIALEAFELSLKLGSFIEDQRPDRSNAADYVGADVFGPHGPQRNFQPFSQRSGTLYL